MTAGDATHVGAVSHPVSGMMIAVIVVTTENCSSEEELFVRALMSTCLQPTRVCMRL